MYKHLVIVVALSSLCCFLYGIVHILLDVERNECRMTYMYQLPTFIKIQVNGEEDFSKYNLFAYAEGRLIENARAMKFTGAPVIFVPGNSGSYKQGRSLASTALRKGMDHDLNHHLDYFLVDFNEEFSALYGEYLVKQAEYLNKCILTVLKLYKHLPKAPKQVVLIGHSMGGKVAQSLLLNETISELINTIIFIATPVDRPVINIDFYMESFYKATNEFLQSHRKLIPFKNDTNCCTAPHWNGHTNIGEENKLLDDKLLISIGGGNRDLLVHAGLTYSKYSDINVMTSAIPNVWLSTDHVASVWCLQLVLVINRFLFSIISSPNNSPQRALSFVEDKAVRLSKASYYFVAPKANNKRRDVNLASEEQIDEWVQDSRRVFTKEFADGVDRPYFQMIPLVIDKRQYKKLYAEAVNLESEDWVFGCDAKEFKRNFRYCSTGYSISHHMEKLPSNIEKRMFVSIDLHKIKKTYPNWTHVILRVLPTRSNVKLNIDIHDPDERTLRIKAPRWYSYTQKQLIADSTIGVSHYKILVSDLDESYQSIQFNIRPRVCSKTHHNAVAKSCIPWVKGFDRYQNFSDIENNPLLLNVPISKPLGYNTTENPVTVNLHLDPSCRYEIMYQNSFAGTFSRIVKQYFHWLPAHLTAILLLSLKYQVSLTPHHSPFKCGKLHSAIVHCGSFFIITVTRIFAKLLQSVKVLPEPDNFHQSLLISFVIHGSASAILLLSTAGIWTLITTYANIVHSIFLRLTRLSSPVFSITLPIIERFPLLAGVILISIALASCGGVALILACCVYFMLITKKYEDFLEQFVFDTIAIIAKKLFGKDVPHKDSKCDEKLASENATKNNSDAFKTNDENAEEDSLLQLLENNLTESNDAPTSTDLVEDVNSEDQEQDKELEKLLNEAIEKQKELLNEKEEKRKMERKEYDGVHEGLTCVHFHMSLFLLLCVLTFLFIPATISWARDFGFSNTLSSDPSIIPATLTIASIFVLWHFSAPRNLYAYNFVASILYVCASMCVIYCQDSVYRLSGIIPSVFVLVTAHQVFSPIKLDANDIDPAEADIRNRIEKMKAVLTDAETNSKKKL